MPFFQIFLLVQSHMPANQHQFLRDILIFVSSKNWCLLTSSKWLRASKIWQNGISYHFYDIFLYSGLTGVGSLSWTYQPVKAWCVKQNIAIKWLCWMIPWSQNSLIFFNSKQQTTANCSVCEKKMGNVNLLSGRGMRA